MQKVIAHFEKVDPVLLPVVVTAFSGPMPIVLRKPTEANGLFAELAESIVSQQLSVKAADTIWGRFKLLVDSKVTPKKVLALDVEKMRAVGLSYQKAGYLQSIAAAVTNGEIDLGSLHKLPDDQVAAELVKLKGVGPWTAEMFLMFTLGRPDVFSFLDLGLLRGFEKAYGKAGVTRADMEPVVAKWAPYRTYAAMALWRHKDSR